MLAAKGAWVTLVSVLFQRRFNFEFWFHTVQGSALLL